MSRAVIGRLVYWPRAGWLVVRRRGGIVVQKVRLVARLVVAVAGTGHEVYPGLRAKSLLDAAGRVTLIARQALQAAVVVQVAGAGCARTVQLSMRKLCALYVHLNLFLVRVGAVRLIGARSRAQTVCTQPVGLACPLQDVQLPLEVSLLPLQAF